MPWVSPWDEISTRIFHELSLKRAASVPKNVIEEKFPNGAFMRKFGCKTQSIHDFIDFGSTRYGKHPDKYIFQLKPDVFIKPKFEKNKLRYHFKRLY